MVDIPARGLRGLFANGSRELEGLAGCGNSARPSLSSFGEAVGPGKVSGCQRCYMQPEPRPLRSSGSRPQPQKRVIFRKHASLSAACAQGPGPGWVLGTETEGAESQTEVPRARAWGTQTSFAAATPAVCFDTQQPSCVGRPRSPSVEEGAHRQGVQRGWKSRHAWPAGHGAGLRTRGLYSVCTRRSTSDTTAAVNIPSMASGGIWGSILSPFGNNLPGQDYAV